MDWDELRYLLALGRVGTLAKAAEQLGVAHTTVGRKLRAIENRLGVRLFDRTPDGFVATVAGLDLITVAERVEAEVLAAESRVLGRDAQLEGSLRVSTMDMVYVGFHDLFASFVARYPKVELTVTTPLERVSLTRREADVAIRLTNRPPEHLVGRRIARVQFAVYAAESLVEAVGPNATLGDYPWIGWDERIDNRWFAGWVEAHAPGAQIVIRFDDSARSRERAISTGLGVQFLACFEGDALPGVVRISDVEPEFSHDLWLLTLRELRNTTRVRALLDHLTEGFERCEHRFSPDS